MIASRSPTRSLTRSLTRACAGSLIFFLHLAASAAECPDVGAQLKAMVATDQQIREEWQSMQARHAVPEREQEALRQRWSAIDAANLERFKDIIARCGWPRAAPDSHNAWLLTQHADKDIAFQRQAKGLLEAAVKAGAGSPADLAYLADRIAANEGRPQEYGTQFVTEDRCSLRVGPVDDIALVERRRREVGLPSLEVYEAQGRKLLLPPDCAPPAK